MEVNSSRPPYLIKGSTISLIVGITSSALPSLNNADFYYEFIVELYIENGDDYTILASGEYTFEQIKKICLSA